MPGFYTVIIGTELLNGRREDGHFPVVNRELLRRGWEHRGNLVIADKPPLIEAAFRLVKEDPESVMFSFGGIGSTPDDYTRQAAANVFGGGKLEVHREALAIIEERFGEAARPHRVKMAELPPGAGLLANPVNRVPGFHLEERYFFVPGFPEMAHPMVNEALERFYPAGETRHRKGFWAQCSENELIHLMAQVPENLELSSLPRIQGESRSVVLSLAGPDEQEVDKWLGTFLAYLEEKRIPFRMGES